MYIKKFISVLFLIITIFPVYKTYAEVSNAGFVPESIWYSVDPFKEGYKIKIYTFLFNPDKRELSGSVSFFDKDNLLGKKNFTIPGNRAQDLSVDWVVTVGTHNIYAKIENAKFLVSKGVYEDANLSVTETKESVRIVKKPVIPLTKGDATIKEEDVTSPSVLVKDIGNTVEEHTPSFISNPLLKAIDFTEGMRTSVDVNISDKRDAVKEDLENIKETVKNDNIFLKPWKYVELFLLTLFYFIFDHKIVFYLILVFLLYLVLRSIWNRFF
ncbi:MAG: hypothetical protein AAB510_00570 [Patescibacteria group bacterium]